MEVLKEKVITASTRQAKPTPLMTVIINSTIRGIVKAANEAGIKREDIVSLLKENGQFILIYYK